MNKKRITVLGIILLLLVAGLAGYQYYKRTPAYTFRLIRESIEQHDYEKFSRHVDTENVLSTSYDALIEAALDDGDADDNVKGMAVGFAKMMKPAIVGALNDEIKQYVKTGASSTDDKDKKKDKNVQVTENFKKQAKVEDMTFKEIGSSRTEGDFTIVSVIFEDKKLERDFNLDLKMKQLEDGTWQVLAISNLKEYLLEEKKAREAKLEEINQPIRAEIASRISLNSPVVQVVSKDAWGFSKMLKVTVSANVNSSVPIQEASGEIKLESTNGEKFQFPFQTDIKWNGGSSSIVLQYDLNPFLDKEAKIIKNKAQNCTAEIDVQKIVYKDGTSLAVKKSLDE